jgi:hypothetical protein
LDFWFVNKPSGNPERKAFLFGHACTTHIYVRTYFATYFSQASILCIHTYKNSEFESQ